MTNYLVIDIEANGALRNKAHPFDPRNKALLVGVSSANRRQLFNVGTFDLSLGSTLSNLEDVVSNSSLLVGFNIKFDLHWLSRLGIRTTPVGAIKVWDCQLAEFLLEGQQNPYNSLNDACEKYGIPKKKDTLTQYLMRGLDVSDIPLPELTEYLEADLEATHQVFLKQQELIDPYWELFNLQCQDLLVLADMEYNGIKYDLEKSKDLAIKCAESEKEILAELANIVKIENPYVQINWNSGDQLSAILYGGTIGYDYKEFVGVYKTGVKAGQPKFSTRTYYHEFPRLVTPLPGSEVKKDGFFKTGEEVLKELKARGLAKEIIKNVLKLSELTKLRGTYFEGIPKKFEEYNWQDSIIHGNLNQCVAITGRLSSSNPNLQNNPKESKECFISRY